MKCRQFESLLPEWAADRLPPEQAQQMQAHQVRCPLCADLTQNERDLRQQWQALSASESLPALWPRLSLRLASFSLEPRHRLPSGLTFTSLALAVSCLGLLTWQHSLRPPTNPVLVVAIQPRENRDEHQLVQMVSDIQSLPDGDSEAFAAEAQQEQRTQQRLLLGRKGL